MAKITGKQWIKKIFDAKAAKKGDIVRRKKTSVQRYASLNDLLDEVKKCNFHLVETGDQYVVVCNAGKWTIHC